MVLFGSRARGAADRGSDVDLLVIEPEVDDAAKESVRLRCALRGLGVLTWFFAPGRLMVALTIGLAIFMWPLLGVFALGIGLGDTWLDWRSRPRPTT